MLLMTQQHETREIRERGKNSFVPLLYIKSKSTKSVGNEKVTFSLGTVSLSLKEQDTVELLDQDLLLLNSGVFKLNLPTYSPFQFFISTVTKCLLTGAKLIVGVFLLVLQGRYPAMQTALRCCTVVNWPCKIKNELH